MVTLSIFSMEVSKCSLFLCLLSDGNILFLLRLRRSEVLLENIIELGLIPFNFLLNPKSLFLFSSELELNSLQGVLLHCAFTYKLDTELHKFAIELESDNLSSWGSLPINGWTYVPGDTKSVLLFDNSLDS